MPKIIWTRHISIFEIFNTQPLWIQDWKQGQESHHIQPSNLSSAIGRAKYKTIGLNLSLPKKIEPEQMKLWT